jgi:hypothetical protein
MLNKLTFTFEVDDDDLTSERIAEYRAAVIRALECVDEGDTTLDYCPLTYKLLHDVNETPEDKGFGQYIKPDGTIFDAHGPVNSVENFELCLALFLSAAQDKIDVYYAASWPNMKSPTLVLDRNRKYIRVVKDDATGGGKSVYCFINTENGDILKGSWKAPVKKGVRGNIYSGDHGADRVNHHGCIYLR